MNKNPQNEARKIFPDGFNNYTSWFEDLNLLPVYIRSARAASVTTASGRRLIDFDLSAGAVYHGYKFQPVQESISKALKSGIGAGDCNNYEIQLGLTLKKYFSDLQQLRFSRSRTEAVLAALRMARAYTKKAKVLKFSGFYHGQLNEFQVKDSSGNPALNLPDRPGICRGQTLDIVVAEYGNRQEVTRVFKRFDRGLAAVIVEPLATAFGVVFPPGDFLVKLKELCNKYKAVLIFDESVTACRGSGKKIATPVDIIPDLRILGGIIGGGMPLAAFGGRKDIMDCLQQKPAVFYDGLFSGNIITAAAGLAALQKINSKTVSHIKKLEAMLREGVRDIIRKKGGDYTFNCWGSVFSFLQTKEPFPKRREREKEYRRKYHRYYNFMLKSGIRLPLNPFAPCFLTAAHTCTDINKYLKVVFNYLQK
ncbi:MAG TPA: aminotransferase class III-fold pyridoxal phosphate-dependent enzyme [Spirochaetota bacterium]|nr:aminotransferase class III-fold pyridoxal phosphate-dependent enzyme [Spirochaetota bacterium]